MMKAKHMIIVVVLFLAIISLYLFSNKTNSSYESNVVDEVTLDVADWKIEIDEQDISTTTRDISLSNIVWDNEHAASGTVAPGSTGVVTVNIDPTSTQVAVKYYISYTDHTMDDDIILTVTSISMESEEDDDSYLLEKVDTDDDTITYYGIFTLDQIESGITRQLVINVEWTNDDENNDSDSEIGLGESEANYLNLVFTAVQYEGE